MRIAMLSWETLHSIHVGGVAAHVTELSAALERAGHEVHVFTRLAPGQRYHDYVEGVNYHRCAYSEHPEFVDETNNMCRALTERVFIVEDMIGRFDLIHAHDWLAANAMIWIKQGRGHKTVFTMHSTEYARCGNVFHDGRSHRVRDQERAGTYWADQVVAVSHRTKEEITWMYETPDWKVNVVYNGVSPSRFDADIDVAEARKDYGIAPLDPTILFCGRLEWQKGPDLLMETIAGVLSYHHNTKFVFLGDGSMRPNLEQRARQLGVDHACRFLGYCSGTEVVKCFKMCDGVVVPSRNEPFGIVVLEAWSASKPVVVTQIGGPAEYVTHELNGLKVFPETDSIGWGLGELLKDFDRARWLGANGRKEVDRCFEWDVIAQQVLTVYGKFQEQEALDQSQQLSQEPSETMTVTTDDEISSKSSLGKKQAS